MVPFENLCTVSYPPFIVTMPLSCIVLEISEILVENHDFFIPLALDAPVMGVSVAILPYRLVQKI